MPRPLGDGVWEGLRRPGDGVVLTKTPKISVIVCTYRGSATLVKCLDSIVALDYPDFETMRACHEASGTELVLPATAGAQVPAAVPEALVPQALAPAITGLQYHQIDGVAFTTLGNQGAAGPPGVWGPYF